MFPFDYLGRWFWVLMILASLVNLVAMRFHIDKLAQGDPQKERMYTKILGVYYGASMIPFLVMVMGVQIGGVPMMFHFFFFRPQDGGPFILVLSGSILVLWVLAIYWILLRDGTQILAEHPDAVTQFTKTLFIKLLVLLAVAGGIFAIFMMFRLNFSFHAFIGY